MKRQILPLLALAFAMALTACGGQTPQAAATTAPVAADTAAPAAPADTAAPATEAPAAPAATAAPAPSTSDAAQPAAGGRLQTIISRGNLICGVNTGLPGFMNVDSAGAYTGFDVDFCKAIAAAIFDDPSKVEYRPLSSQDRFTAVQTGEVDVLIRNSTFTLSRDGSLGLDWAPTTFYDGQGMMVRKDSGINTLEDMDGATVCVQTGTTTELNLADQFKARGLTFTPVVFDSNDPTVAAYDAGQCDGFTTDKSGLVSSLSKLTNPADHKILDVTMSKEPLGPSTLSGDAQFSDAVRWIVYATFQAEEYGITSANIGDFTSSELPEIQRFLGLADNKLGDGIGLPNDFAVRVIKGVGNYAEIYDRNLGPTTPFDLPRGLNSLYTSGGLLYSPPFR
ncbi:amino acid ABC transporter substrate-binding protein [Oscillochloris sp. ZM17-4]|uniref:amino acid ABC transporter substrate-binding protein n=1 Tax=Oscillochloris sp. ZM17-4 TaxID=2866714 RepID=UPI001C73B7B8|nr:amino acid ABC transporter substrate-binding protein [Oscillochloris sp. ZM17-4]MBX0326636.1 amino acid ABC transporter substrate-binding protein [Oscillochloris sp. ZM17-4]